jgi:hypothetical protein
MAAPSRESSSHLHVRGREPPGFKARRLNGGPCRSAYFLVTVILSFAVLVLLAPRESVTFRVAA